MPEPLCLSIENCSRHMILISVFGLLYEFMLFNPKLMPVIKKRCSNASTSKFKTKRRGKKSFRFNFQYGNGELTSHFNSPRGNYYVLFISEKMVNL